MNRKRFALATAMVLAAVALVVAVLLQRGNDALKKSDDALARGDLPAAIVFAERAAQARLPWSPHAEEGYRRLLEIGDQRASENDDATAKLAYAAALRAARTTGDVDHRSAGEARAGLAKIEARSKVNSATGTVDRNRDRDRDRASTELAPAPRVRFALAASVILVIAGLASLTRNARYAWPLLAVGLVALVFAALQ